MSDSSMGPHGRLDVQHLRAHRDSVPAQVLAYFKSVGHDAESLADEIFATNLIAHHFRPHKDGKFIGGEHFPLDARHPEHGRGHVLVEARVLHSGLITNAGVNMMAYDWSWIGAATPFSTIGSMNYHGVGTGATAAAAADYSLQTAVGAGSLTGSTNGYFTGTQSNVAPNTYQTVATVSINATLALTEWALLMSNAANVARTATGTPTATTFPDSGASFTTAGNGLKGWTAEINASAINTPTTTVMGLVTSNTATQLNLAAGWFTLANASASTPGANVAYVVYPTMWDHKAYSAINAVAGDSVSYTYKASISSGG